MGYKVYSEQTAISGRFILTAVKGNARHDFWFDAVTRHLFASPMNRKNPPKSAYVSVRDFSRTVAA